MYSNQQVSCNDGISSSTGSPAGGSSPGGGPSGSGGGPSGSGGGPSGSSSSSSTGSPSPSTSTSGSQTSSGNTQGNPTESSGSSSDTSGSGSGPNYARNKRNGNYEDENDDDDGYSGFEFHDPLDLMMNPDLQTEFKKSINLLRKTMKDAFVKVNIIKNYFLIKQYSKYFSTLY